MYAFVVFEAARVFKLLAMLPLYGLEISWSSAVMVPSLKKRLDGGGMRGPGGGGENAGKGFLRQTDDQTLELEFDATATSRKWHCDLRFCTHLGKSSTTGSSSASQC